MCSSLKIQRILFAEQGLTLIIRRSEDGEYFHCGVNELFRNDQMLTDFSASDIRLISYFAATEEFATDSRCLKTPIGRKSPRKNTVANL